MKRKKIEITVEYGFGTITEYLFVEDIQEATDLVSKYNGLIIEWKELK